MSAEVSAAPSPARSVLLVALRHALLAPRFYVYLSCTIAAVLTSYHLGKEMMWDTMDYHIYAGFSALHDRFNQDYFAAGPQGYFNPYSYVPFYLLLRSKLAPLEDASILAALQSGILWLTFELALAAAPQEKPNVRLAVGLLAVVLAFANPVLITELGSSFTDISTAEIALAGWLLIVTVIRSPGVARVIWAALLLGTASALKPTNAVHAVSAVPMLLFVPGDWRSRFRYAALLVAGIAVAFVLISAPWSVHLERHFGNPVFPLLNGLFRSPEFTTAPMVNYEFIPASFGAALLRPLAIAFPRGMIHVEWIAPDCRYALLLALTLLLSFRFLRRRGLHAIVETACQSVNGPMRVLAALGCGFLLDWMLWLAASGNSRYFMPMACVAAVLDVALLLILLIRPKVRAYLLAGIFGLQLFQLCVGAEYRAALPWKHGSWFNLSLPAELASQPKLYFTVGELTNSFIVPYFAAASGFINLDGEYVLGPDGQNGEHIEALIKRFAPHLRVLVRVPQGDVYHGADLPDLESIDDALSPFGLMVQGGRCSKIVAAGLMLPSTTDDGRGGRQPHPTVAHTEFLAACHLMWSGAARAQPFPGQRAADLAFDHLEEACPALFQPRRPVDTMLGDQARGYVFVRHYANTDVVAWVADGSVRFQNPIGGVREQNLGAEGAWEQAPLHLVCRREGFLNLQQPILRRNHIRTLPVP